MAGVAFLCAGMFALFTLLVMLAAVLSHTLRQLLELEQRVESIEGRMKPKTIAAKGKPCLPQNDC
jgi:hypothetical protein